MFLVGLTGGIAAGKSRVAARFAERGAEVIDADVIAREVVRPGREAWRKLVDHFGEAVLDDRGEIDRPRLGRIVFADPAKRALLNEITHPPVMAEIADRLEALASHEGMVVLDVPLLVESGARRGYDAIVVVAAERDTQVRRLVELRGIERADAEARIDAQAPLEDKLAVATHVIWNDGSMQELLARTDAVIHELDALARDKARSGERDLPDRDRPDADLPGDAHSG
jgi:dephospho-CoA kinase